MGHAHTDDAAEAAGGLRARLRGSGYERARGLFLAERVPPVRALTPSRY